MRHNSLDSKPRDSLGIPVVILAVSGDNKVSKCVRVCHTYLIHIGNLYPMNSIP